MAFSDLAPLEPLGNQDIFILVEPETLDFTSSDKVSGKLIIFSKNTEITISLPEDKKPLLELVSHIQHYFNRAVFVTGWDLKNFFTYIQGKIGKPFELSTNCYDLKVIESYLGFSMEKPLSYAEAADRFRKCFKHKSWESVKKVYRCVYNPLVTKVIPKIETLGLVHYKQKTALYPHYEMDGANGRLKCSTKYFKKSFNPHSLQDEDKKNLKPRSFDEQHFLFMDFRHMEVSVLQWLSKDPLLAHILNSGQDLYEAIYETVVGPIDSNGREKAKQFFLPIMFGQGVSDLASTLNISFKTADILNNRVRTKFSTAYAWITTKDVDSEGFCEDYFGRNRKFEDRFYRIRNFIVQSPSSLICLHKLIRLYSITQSICFHVHDGYAVILNKKDIQKVAKETKAILEQPEELYPDLKLKVKCYQGPSLANLEEI